MPASTARPCRLCRRPTKAVDGVCDRHKTALDRSDTAPPRGIHPAGKVAGRVETSSMTATDTHNPEAPEMPAIVIDRTIPVGQPVDDNLSLGRCHRCAGGRRVWAWPTGTLTLAEATCPSCGDQLGQTTRMMRAPVSVIARDSARKMAKAARDAAKAARDVRIAAGGTRLVRDLRPGDVFVDNVFTFRVVAIDPTAAKAKSHVGLVVARLASDVNRSQPWATTKVSRPARREVTLRHADLVWADLAPGVALLNMARRVVHEAEHGVTFAEERLTRARAGNGFLSIPQAEADVARYRADLAAAYTTKDLLETAAAAAGVEVG